MPDQANTLTLMKTPMPILNALSIVVEDMAASIPFYRACGLEFADDGVDAPHTESTAFGGFRILLDTARSIAEFDPAWSTLAKGGRISLAFECADPAEVDSRYAELTGAGHTGRLEPFDAFWGQRYATVVDPDGNSVDFYAPST